MNFPRGFAMVKVELICKINVFVEMIDGYLCEKGVYLTLFVEIRFEFLGEFFIGEILLFIEVQLASNIL